MSWVEYIKYVLSKFSAFFESHSIQFNWQTQESFFMFQLQANLLRSSSNIPVEQYLSAARSVRSGPLSTLPQHYLCTKKKNKTVPSHKLLLNNRQKCSSFNIMTIIKRIHWSGHLKKWNVDFQPLLYRYTSIYWSNIDCPRQMVVPNYWPLFRIRIDRIGTPIISLMCLKEAGLKPIITAKSLGTHFLH